MLALRLYAPRRAGSAVFGTAIRRTLVSDRDRHEVSRGVPNLYNKVNRLAYG